MKMNHLTPVQMIATHSQQQITNTGNEQSTSFSKMLSQAINDVNALQSQSDQQTERLVKGENVDLHNVMISAQKASISLQATIEIRNKVVEAYQEMMRMQV